MLAAAETGLAAGGGAALGAPHKSTHRAKHRAHRPKHRAHRPKHRKRAAAHRKHHPARRRGRVARSQANPLSGRAMWIWELPYADGGNLGSIIATAHRYGVSTLIIKSSDGTSLWSQFNSSLVATLHANGLRVCAWQYVYGSHPVTEAYLGTDAVRDGADCLLIDAESEYEGKYVAAQTYITQLRTLVGARYPLALAGFPYLDYHPAFPYSVFLGPGGAQYNAPQMYWKDIGTTVDAVFAHTYSYNLIYRRPIYPLGQVYSNPPAHQIVRFRQLSRAYGASGVSWWDWQEATGSAWSAVSRPAGSLSGYVPYRLMASIGTGAKGDLVVWAQEHLISAGYKLGVDGDFGRSTRNAVAKFQLAHGLGSDGIIGPETWRTLLRYRPVRIVWAAAAHARRAAGTRVSGPGSGASSGLGSGPSSDRGAASLMPVPKSASRPARRDEIAGAGGAGHPTAP